MINYRENRITCDSCGLTANRREVFRSYGRYVVSARCSCGESVETGVRLSDICAFQVDFETFANADDETQRAMIANARIPGDLLVDESIPLNLDTVPVQILEPDEDTPDGVGRVIEMQTLVALLRRINPTTRNRLAEPKNQNLSATMEAVTCWR